MIPTIKVIDQVVTDRYAIYNGDSCEVIRAFPDDSVHFGVHSPPFEGLYKFTDSDRDISNNEGDSFWQHYGYLILSVPGYDARSAPRRACHAAADLQGPSCVIGVRDFRGDVIRAYQAAGWIFHSEICIWKDPVVAQQRTKSIRLLHKQIVKDSTISGQGLADYIVVFRKPGANPVPVAGCFDCYVGSFEEPDRAKYTGPFDGRNWYSIEVWQRYASPVWTDIRQTRVLSYRKAREEKDEAHISPLQLDVVERCVDIWSNPGEIVLTPFLGIGTEVYSAVEMSRYGVGIELNPSYFRQAVTNMAELDKIEAETRRRQHAEALRDLVE